MSILKDPRVQGGGAVGAGFIALLAIMQVKPVVMESSKVLGAADVADKNAKEIVLVKNHNGKQDVLLERLTTVVEMQQQMQQQIPQPRRFPKMRAPIERSTQYDQGYCCDEGRLCDQSNDYWYWCG